MGAAGELCSWATAQPCSHERVITGRAAPLPQQLLPLACPARRTFNSRVLRWPAATVYARTAADVAAAVACAQRHAVPVSPAAGRQGLLGGAVQDGALTIDVTALTKASNQLSYLPFP